MKEHWKGIHKLTEESGEVLQLLGKLGAFPEGPHPDGQGDLKERLEDELADLSAAASYFAETNELDLGKMQARSDEKLEKFRHWGLTGVITDE